MTNPKNSEWTEDEDLQLAEIILRHIREGSTQSAGFEEAETQIGRTAKACGFRWNNAVRKDYKHAIEIAIQHRKDEKKEKSTTPVIEKLVKMPMNMKDVIEYLQTFDDSYMLRYESLKNAFDNIEKSYEELVIDHEELLKRYHQLSQILRQANQLTLKEPEGVKVSINKEGWVEKVTE